MTIRKYRRQIFEIGLLIKFDFTVDTPSRNEKQPLFRSSLPLSPAKRDDSCLSLGMKREGRMRYAIDETIPKERRHWRGGPISSGLYENTVETIPTTVLLPFFRRSVHWTENGFVKSTIELVSSSSSSLRRTRFEVAFIALTLSRN